MARKNVDAMGAETTSGSPETPIQTLDEVRARISGLRASGAIKMGESPEALLETLRIRFLKNKERHEGVKWPEVEEIINSRPENMEFLKRAAENGYEIDVVGIDREERFVDFADCSENPLSRTMIRIKARPESSSKGN